MSMGKPIGSVKAEAAADAPIAYDPETDPYDPNDEAAVKAYWNAGVVIGPDRLRGMNETVVVEDQKPK